MTAGQAAAVLTTLLRSDVADEALGIITFSGGVSGTEGGEVRFTEPVSGSSIGGIVTVDINANRMRFFTTDYAGALRGVVINFATIPDGTLQDLWNGGNYRRNLAATAAPGTGNDGTQGYAVGSDWFDVTNDDAYVCLDASTGAAVWKKTTP